MVSGLEKQSGLKRIRLQIPKVQPARKHRGRRVGLSVALLPENATTPARGVVALLDTVKMPEILSKMESDETLSTASKRKAEESDEESDEEVWEEVVAVSGSADAEALPPENEGIEVTVAGIESAKPPPRVRQVKITKELREIRLAMHQTHLMLLTRAAVLRNEWANDPLLQATALSILAPKIEKPSKSAKKPPKATLQSNLVETWLRVFRTEQSVAASPNADSEPILSLENGVSPEMIIEAISSEKSRPLLKNHRNACAILFTALARAWGFRVRLVAALFPVPLSFANTALAPCYRPHASIETMESENDFDFDTLVASGSQDVESTPPKKNKRRKLKAAVAPREEDALKLWVQIFSQSTDEWNNLDPCALLDDGTVDPSNVTLAPTTFEMPASAPDQQQLAYVLACNQDGTIKDVSKMFSTRWASRISKVRPQGEADIEWWRMCVWLGSGDRNASKGEVIEDAAIKRAPESESMPTRLDGFKNNAIYALKRHLNQSEIIHPEGIEHSIGNFKGELVYPRRNVREVLNAINWRKRGRQIKEGESPMKTVKARVSTLARKREIEADRINNEGGGGAEENGLFAEWQTEEITPEALVDGKIPKNRFGNFEILHPNMLPDWGAHVNVTGAAAVARKLKLDYTGFEHHKGRATPVISGVMVLKENKLVLKEAIEEDQRNAQMKAAQQKSKRCLQNWKKLIEKALIVSDLNEKYLS
ncbi:hypothetical protein HDU80_003634 [Chytriomyces hyalinus]|nr:hypothetical protein HDU80_003634 [Chytriomyces hyalinus]